MRRTDTLEGLADRKFEAGKSVERLPTRWTDLASWDWELHIRRSLIVWSFEGRWMKGKNWAGWRLDVEGS